MMRKFFLALLVLVACKGRQPTTAPAPTAAPPPAWVSARPVSSMYYIGIGQAPKARPDHQETAKKNALNDMASEISVRVEGNSLLHTLDTRKAFDETFTSTIRTRTNEQLEGFQLVETWESPTEYWTYYRLDKSEHARLKAQRKQAAINQATDLFGRAQASIAAGDLRSAFDQDLRALLAMKEYWGESDIVELNGRPVPLANEIYSDLQRLVSGIRLAILPERCELDYAGHYRRELLISAEHASTNGARDLVQLPLRISYPGQSGRVTETRNTDTEGRARTTIQRVQLDAVNPEVVVTVDLDALVTKDLDPPFVKALTNGLASPEKRAPITARMPRVHLRATETNLDQPVGDAGVSVALREELTKRGFRFVDRESEADLHMELNASTRQAGSANGFFTTLLDVTFTLRDRKTQEVVYEGGRQGVKGVQLDFQKAGMEAYKKAAQDLRKESVPALLNALL
ncbi:MAG: LPP20 family lipoprotein [Flavobacteriales bacterium]|nr:LPP20 family lipoprotein [Flavobacteriales bacterium]